MTTGIEERLFTIRYKVDEQSHLKIRDQGKCNECSVKECNFFCPADVYLWHEDEQLMSVAYENCIECGTCRLACPEKNIEWTYPLGGHGISYKNG